LPTSRPSKKTLRLHRAAKGPKLFTPQETRSLLAAAGTQMKAMILLGINCGFGNADCGRLPVSAVDLDAAMIDFPRPKTGIPRRCPLWPETVQAIREAVDRRPEPKDAANAGLVFITKYGLPWAKDTADQTLAKEFGKLLKALKINGRKGLGFYTLRHTFRTVADDSGSPYRRTSAPDATGCAVVGYLGYTISEPLAGAAHLQDALRQAVGTVTGAGRSASSGAGASCPRG